MTTKERIIDEALTLFSIKGYKGTSVKNIAEAVGIKDSSLYKHFSSKQEILDTIVETMRGRIEDMSHGLGLPEGTEWDKAAELYAGWGEDELVDFSKKVFLFYLTDSYLSRFWRLGNIEQYGNPAVYALFRKLFLEDSITYQTELFGVMVRKGFLIDIKPEIIAMSFYGPFFFLLSKFSVCPQQEEKALEILDRQVREFYRVYKR